jgi:peptidoglycan/LPS O-acetylase OafA/YrhL
VSEAATARNDAFDGLRAVAIVMVLLFHARAPAGLGGFLGVDVFFVLSGYLISSLLLRELADTGRVDLRRFYVRRLLRLTPALLAMLAAYLALAPLAWPQQPDHAVQAAVTALYLSDYGLAFWGTPSHLSHTWSLAVEMHFYLLWPLLLAFLWRRRSRRSLVILLGAGYLLATLLRWVALIDGQTWEQVYYRFDTRLSGLLLGAWFAAACEDPPVARALERAQPWLLWAAVGTLLCLQFRWHDLWMLTWGVTFAEWGTLALLAAVRAGTGPLTAMLALPPLAWLGRLSYGLYLWHFPVFLAMRGTFAWDAILLLGGLASLAMAALSFYTIERWALSLRSRGPKAISADSSRSA